MRKSKHNSGPAQVASRPASSRLDVKERCIVATLLAYWPAQLPPLCARLLSHAPESFEDFRFGVIAAAIHSLATDAKPVALLTVQEHLAGKGKLGDAGGGLFLDALDADAVTMGVAEHEAAYVWQAFSERKAKTVLADAQSALESKPDALPTILDGVLNTLAAIRDDSSKGNSNSLPNIVDCHAMLTKPLQKPPEIICGLLHQGTKLVVGGGSKSFKTWTLLDLAASVATGSPWWEIETRPGRVLYVNFEIPQPFFQERLAAVLRAKNIELQPGQLDSWHLRGRAVDVDFLLTEFITRLSGRGYVLTILDPTYKLMGRRDENAAGDVASLLNAFERLGVETGSAVAFGAHFSKGNQSGKESLDRISGSGVFARDPDSILTLTRHEQEGAFVVEPILRNLPPMPGFCVQWEYPLMRRVDLDPAKLKQAGGRKAEHDAGQLLEVLSAGGLENKAWVKAAADEHGISSRTFYRLRHELHAAGKVLKSRVNGKWMPIAK